MIATVKFGSISSDIALKRDSIDDFIKYIKIIAKRPETVLKPVLNDPNPIMCYVGDQRVIPGTETPFNVSTYDIDEPLMDTDENDDNFNPDRKTPVIVENMLEGKRFINCTPHNIVFHYKKTGEVIIMQPSYTLIRVFTEFERTTNDPSIYNRYKAIHVSLPEPKEGVIYIVSQVVFNLFPERKDLVFPNSIHAVRDENNKVIGVHSFVTR